MALLAASRDGTHAPPDSLHVLLERFDATVFDAPQGRARIRLIIPDAGQWDVLAGAGGATITTVDPRVPADATLSADQRTWEGIARDLRGGMDAYRAGRLVIRHNLHLGVGLLAATSGVTGPARLRFQRIQVLI